MKCEEEKQFKKELDEMSERIKIFTESKEEALRRQAKAIFKDLRKLNRAPIDKDYYEIPKYTFNELKKKRCGDVE